MIRSWGGPLREELSFPSWINLTRRSFVITLARPLSQDLIYWPSRGPQNCVTIEDTATSNLLLLSRFVKGNTLKTIPCWCAFRFFINFDNAKSYTLKFETKRVLDQSLSFVSCECCQATGQYTNISNYDKLPRPSHGSVGWAKKKKNEHLKRSWFQRRTACLVRKPGYKVNSIRSIVCSYDARR